MDLTIQKGTGNDILVEVTPSETQFVVIDRGIQGATGATGAAATIAVGTTSTLAAGVPATVANTGTSAAAVFDFGIPQGIQGVQGVQGNTGTAATIAVGTTSTIAAGSPATVTNVGTSAAAVFNFAIPQGAAGTGDVSGAASSTDNAIARFDGTTGKIIQNSAVTIADDGSTVIAANSTTNGLRITQIGTGNALVVEDSANPDATPFVVSATGLVGIGTTAPSAALDIGSTLSGGVFASQIFSANNSAAAKTNYVKIDASVAFNPAGSEAGAYTLQVLQNNAYKTIMDVGGALVNASNYLAFGTTNEAMRIDSAGEVGIGTTTPTSKLHVFGTTKTGGILVEDSSTSLQAPAIEVIGKRSDANGFPAFSGKLLLARNRTDAAIASNITLGAVAFGGNHTDGTLANILYPASIVGLSTGAFSSATAMPTSLLFYTGSTGVAPDTLGVTIGTERMRVSDTGVISLGAAPGSESLRVTPVASAVNYLNVSGAVTTGAPVISAQGSDTNIGLTFTTKGTGSIVFNCPSTVFAFGSVSGTDFTNYFTQTGSLTYAAAGSSTDINFVFAAKGAGNLNLKTGGGTQLLVANTASAVNYLQTTGAATGVSPTISAQGSDANIGITLTPKGTGKVISTTDATINGITVGKGGGSLSNNTAVGSGALALNTTGNQNTGVGFNALYFTNTGIFNTAVGTSAMTCNTVASFQTAVGYQALINATTAVATFGAITGGSGYTNGTYTAVAMTPVSGATFVTYPTVTVVVAGGAVTTVTLVTAGIIASSTAATVLTVAAALLGGTGSGFSIPVATFVTGANNTAIGYQTLVANTAGSNNTALGFQAGSTLVSGGNNLILGNGAAGSTTTVSNEITLGNSSITAFRIPGLSISAGASALTIGSQFAVTNTASAVNYVQATGAVTTAAPTLSAQGSDTNIDLKLTPKGTGVLSFGTYTAGILAQTGYITIKDAAGTTRNLLVG